MKQNRKHKRRHHANWVEKSLVVCGEVKDPVAARAVHEIDAADDRRWLAEHPNEEARHRAATIRELMAYGLPPSCRVVVARGPVGSQIRMIFPPEK